MNRAPISILNIGLDRDLLSRGARTEAQTRQLYYANNLPARLVHLVKAPRDASDQPIELDARLTVVPCPVSHWAWFLPSVLRRGSAVLASERFDLIQVQEPFLSGLAGILLARRFRIPLVVGLYSDEIDNPIWLAERPLNHVANLTAKWVLGHAAAARSDSKAVVDRLGPLSLCPLTYIPFLITHAALLATSTAAADVTRARLLDGREGPLLLAVCRLEKEKNLHLMLAAFAKLARQRSGPILAIAGHGSQAESLAREAERLAPGRVRWLGWIANTDMPAYYQAADLMLLSSNRESAARVLFESLLAGTPVLSTDTAGAREAVDDRISGRIVPVGDTEAFARALGELCGHPAGLEAMGKEGRERMLRRVTGEAVAQQLHTLYEGVLGRAA
jgi:glycosyltransferase involved in cell wall biosynthesis